MKKIRTLGGTLLAAVALLAVAVSPSGADPVGGGSFFGDVIVTTAGGIDLDPRPTRFEFVNTVFTGTFTENDDVFLGQVELKDKETGGNVRSGGEAESTISGEGWIVPFVFQPQPGSTGSLVGECAAGTYDDEEDTGTGDAFGDEGGYSRVGGVVLMTAHCTGSIGDTPFDTIVRVVAHAVLTADGGDGVTTPVKKAQFTGVYATAA